MSLYFLSLAAKCGDPLDHQILSVNNFIISTGYTNPALEGSSVNFSCPSELVLDGFKSSICMGNGKWEPDPRVVKCKGENPHNYQNITKFFNVHDMHITANCDLSILPTGGYIISDNTSTTEGTTVTFVCPGNLEKITICTAEGQWEPNSSNICAEAADPSGTHNYFTTVILL